MVKRLNALKGKVAPCEWDTVGTGDLSLCSLLSLQSTCQHEGLVTETSAMKIGGHLWGGWHGPGCKESPWGGGRVSCKNSPLSAQKSLSLLQGKRIGSPQRGLRADTRQESFFPTRRRYGAVRKDDIHPCKGRVERAASFTFTLSSGAHDKALLALAVVGARGVDASLSLAGRVLLTFILIWQQIGRQS